jgi:hypothetical protein
MVAWLSIAGAVVVAMLGWNLRKRLAADGIRRFEDDRRASSRMVSSADFIDGSRHIPVSLALNEVALYYENSNVQASLDLDWIQEVEYEDDGKVLRLRCFSRVFEFILPANMFQRWQAVLPAA